MKKDFSAIQKQSGKITVIPVVTSGAKGTQLKHSDTVYYQVSSHGDYVQERN